MRLVDLALLFIAWFLLVLSLYTFKRVKGAQNTISIYYGVAVVVKGRQHVTQMLDKLKFLVDKIPDVVLIPITLALFFTTMFLFVPVPFLIAPTASLPIFIFDMFLVSPTLAMVRNLILIVKYVTEHVHKYTLIQEGFLTLQPLIPGITASITVFLMIIIAAGISITVHELAHGLVARKYNIPVKSGGFFSSFLILMGGFVEIDEEELARVKLTRRLAVYAAGVVANILLAYVTLMVYMLLCYLTSTFNAPLGVKVVMSKVDTIPNGSLILAVNDQHVYNIYDFADKLVPLILSGQREVSLLVKLPDGTIEQVLLHINLNSTTYVLNPRSSTLLTFVFNVPPIAVTNTVVYNFLFWLLTLNVSIALLNAIPAYPLDGGQILQAMLERVCKNRKLVQYVYYAVSAFFWVCLLLTITYTFKTGLYLPAW